MPKPIYEWSEVDAVNAFAPADGGCAEGWLGRDVNDAARARMSAMASFYQDSEWRFIFFQLGTYGAKTFARDSDTVFRIVNESLLSHFPAGRRLRTYDGVGGTADVWVESAQIVGSDTEVTISGVLASPLSDVAVHQNSDLSTLVYGGTGSTVSRDAEHGTTPPDFVLWLNETTKMIEVSRDDTWHPVVPIDSATADVWADEGGTLRLRSPATDALLVMSRGADERFRITASGTASQLRHLDAGATQQGLLELDDDGNVYYTKAAQPRAQALGNAGAFQMDGQRWYDVGPREARLSADRVFNSTPGGGTTPYAVGTILAGCEIAFDDSNGGAYSNEFGIQVDVELFFQHLGGAGSQTFGNLKLGLHIGTTGALDPTTDTRIREWNGSSLPAVASGTSTVNWRGRHFGSVNLASGESLYLAFEHFPAGSVGHSVDITFKASAQPLDTESDMGLLQYSLYTLGTRFRTLAAGDQWYNDPTIAT